MKNKNRNNFKAMQQGFSLIEVLVVMTILAVIFGMVAKNVMGGKEKADYKYAQSMVLKIHQAVEEFYLDTGKLPDSLDQLVNDTGDSMWMGAYLKEKELKDPWGEQFMYSAQSQHGQSFDVYTYASDKSPGGDKLASDVGNWQ